MSQKFLFDLIFHDGPLTSVFEVDGAITVYDWICQYEDIGHDWHIFKVNAIDLKRYIRGEIKFIQLVESTTDSCFIRFDTNLDILCDDFMDMDKLLEDNPDYGNYENDDSLNFSKEEIESWISEI
jgi:hypothetical protein